MPVTLLSLFRSPESTEQFIREGLAREPAGGRSSPRPPGQSINPAVAVAEFFVSPFALANQLFGGGSRPKYGYDLVPVLDETTGTASLSLPSGLLSGLKGKLKERVDQAVSKINANLSALAQQALTTGVVPENVPRAARQSIDEFAAIGRSRNAAPQPGSPEPSFPPLLGGGRRDFVPPIIPTGANSGWLTQTPAAKALLASLAGSVRRTSPRKRRRKRRARRSISRRSTTRSATSTTRSAKRSKRSQKFVKGSAAAKRFMAKLRAKRRK
jgi:hypothetical protein